MSMASAAGVIGRPSAPVRHWLRLFGSELRNVFFRPRNLAMLAVLAGAPVFLGVVLKINTPAPGSGGEGAGVFVGQIADNGVFLSLFAIYVLLTVLLPLAVSVVSGDSVAGEAGHGTLRTLLMTKYLMIVVFCFAATFLVAGLGLLTGAIFFPVGPVTLLSGNTVSLVAGLGRLVLIACYVAVALSALGAIGLALSTFTQHAIAVMATVLVIVIISEILDAVSQVAAIHPYLPSHFWFSFDALLRMPIDWFQVLRGLASFAAYIVIFGAVALTRMRRANITC